MAVSQPSTQEKIGAHWGRAVAARRTELRLSQAQLAELCDVTQQTISKIEAGGLPRDGLKLVIANRMGIEPSVLFAWPERSVLIEGVA